MKTLHNPSFHRSATTPGEFFVVHEDKHLDFMSRLMMSYYREGGDVLL